MHIHGFNLDTVIRANFLYHPISTSYSKHHQQQKKKTVLHEKMAKTVEQILP